MPRDIRSITILFFLLTVMLQIAEACDESQVRLGCKIQGRLCVCGLGCPSEYRYTSKEECRKAVNGNGPDICSRSPCHNEGSCIQTSTAPGFRCRCEGTGFYGRRCERACPTADQGFGSYPYECIVI